MSILDKTNEPTVRAAADTAEAGTRGTADSTLTTNVATNATAITNEASARAGADSTHAALTTTAHGGLAPTVHSHAEADTTSLVSDLAARSLTSHGHTHAATTGQTTDDHHAQSHVHNGLDGSGTIKHSNLTSVTADQHHAQLHAAAHATGLPDALTPGSIGASATGHSHAESDVTSLTTDLAGKSATSHTHTHAATTGQGVDDHHAKSHTHNADGSGTVPYSAVSGTPTNLAVTNADNAFTVGQGVRGALSGAAGLSVPWIVGDAAPALVGGALTAGNTQPGVQGFSDSAEGVQGSSGTGTGVLGIISGAGAGALEGRYTGSAATVRTLLALRNSTSAAGAAGTGSQIQFTSKSDTTLSRTQAALQVTWVTATDASRAARVTLTASDFGGPREGLRVEASGTAPLLGFFGHAAAAVPTISGTQNANAGLAALLTGLAGLGLVTDSTTTGTAPAFPNADNAFTVGQGVRAALGSSANGLYAPWITGDTHPTVNAGAATSGNNQTAVLGTSDSGIGVAGTSASSTGVQGTSATGVSVLGLMSGAGTAPLEGQYTGSLTTIRTLLALRNSTSGTGAAGTGGQIQLLAKSDTTLSRSQASIQATWVVATDASRTARLLFNVFDANNLREGLRIEASGAAGMVGFLGHAASVQQSLAAAATDLASVITLANGIRTALLNFGLCA